MMNDVLAHHGILGMKWGVRRTPEQLNRASGRKQSTESQKEQKEPQKNSKTLTDEELRKVVSRLELEKRYLDLIKPPAPNVSKGRKFVEKVLNDSGTKIATTLVSGYGLYKLGQIIEKKSGVDVAQKILGGKKK